MTRDELLKKMVKAYQDLPRYPDGEECMSAVLDLLTKESVRTRRSAHWNRVESHAGCFDTGLNGPEVDLLVLDLPERERVAVTDRRKMIRELRAAGSGMLDTAARLEGDE